MVMDSELKPSLNKGFKFLIGIHFFFEMQQFSLDKENSMLHMTLKP